ncbi:MAG TPA: hypothetical protein VFU31_24175 [Candidatus Binatia bacterium]|nr:hypothetical protein [Candidatus Binatia bacterium]
MVGPQDKDRIAPADAVKDLSGSTDNSQTKWSAWALRPIVLFGAAYMIVGVLHEFAHALTAYLLKVPFTLLHVGVNLDRAHGTLNQHAVIGVAGPVFALALGLLCWWAYRRAQQARSGLLSLYLAMFGMGTFFGNLISTSFVGDFSRAALAFQLPMPIRYGTSIVGALLLCALSFFIGSELRRWAPVGIGRAKAMIGMVALPVIVGTAIMLLVFLPMPFAFALGRFGEASFWIFGVVGALLSRKPPVESSQNLGLGWSDFAIFLIAFLVVRVMARGITFVP